jgi:hypothetical protein
VQQPHSPVENGPGSDEVLPYDAIMNGVGTASVERIGAKRNREGVAEEDCFEKRKI